MRQDAGRGFDVEDDGLFCPALLKDKMQQHHMSPTFRYAGLSTAVAATGSQGVSMQGISAMHSSHFVGQVPRARKPLDIIDPATGLPIDSQRYAG